MDEDAATAALALLIAGGLFVGIIGVALVTVQQQGGDSREVDAAIAESRASAVAKILLDHPGFAAGGAEWDANDVGQNPDALVRLGLLEPGSYRLSFEKLQNLRLAPYATTADGLVNYEEARQQLGLSAANMDFHVRGKPSLASVEEILGGAAPKDSNMRVTYLGDVQASGGSNDANPDSITCIAGAAGTYEIKATITNPTTSANPTQFTGYLTLDPPGGGQPHTQWMNGPIVGIGVSHDLTAIVPADRGYCDAGATIDVDIYDPSGVVGTGSTTMPATISAGSHSYDLWVDTSKSFYASSEDITLEYDGNGLDKNQPLTLAMFESDGTPVPLTLNAKDAGKNNERTWVIPASEVPGQDTYTVELSDGTVTVEEVVLVHDGVINDFTTGGTTSISSSTGGEVTALDQLVEKFCPFMWDNPANSQSAATLPAEQATRCGFPGRYTGHSGDVLIDEKSVMTGELPKRLVDGSGNPSTQYVTHLFVGSGVDHNAMTAGAAKHAVRDWVLAGGTLVVFGSTDQSVQWLQPLFHSAIASSSGGLSTPDSTHPLLTIPNALDHDDFDNHGKGWKFNSGSGDHFTQVVKDGSDQAVLAISDPGAFGLGQIMLTSWTPHDILGDGSNSQEGMALMHNLLSIGYRDLFIDYGPELPSGMSVIPAVRRMTVDHPELGEDVALNMIVYVFPEV